MSMLPLLLARVRGVFDKDRADRVLADEIKNHLELLAADYARRGMTELAARYAAARELGNITSIREQYREQNGLPFIENFRQDLKYALRTLRRNRTFTAACLATITVGLGSMITVLCVASAVLWKPLPYPHPEELFSLKEVDPRNGLWTFSQPTLLDVQGRSGSLAALAAYRRDTLALTGVGEPASVQAAAVTPSFFKMFGIKPVAGALFHNSLPYVVISRELWKRKWQMNPLVVGRAVVLDGQSYTVAGVADAPVDLLSGVELFSPLTPRAAESRTAHEIEAVGRLRAGVAERQAQAELSAIASTIAREHAQTNAGWSIRIMRLSDSIAGPNTGRLVWMILAAVALLWVLACANVAGLQIARSVARGHEMSTRLALGASRGRLFAQTLTEGVVLAFAGGILGLIVAQYATEAIRNVAARSLPRMANLHLDATAIGIALGCIFASAILFGVLSGRTPVFQQGREIATRNRGRDALIVLQVALASILLVAASLLSQSFLRLQAVDPGFDPQRVLSVRVSLPAGAYDNVQRVGFFRDAPRQLGRLPQVESVGATNVVPFSGQGTANRFRVAGEPTSTEFRSAAWRAVTPGFFTALGIPLKKGRLFTQADARSAPEVVILSESMAKRFWPNQDPIGQLLLWGRSGSPKTIVGVVGDLRDLAVAAAPVPTMFRPFAQLPDAPMTLIIRTKIEPAAATLDIRRAIWTVDRNAALEFQSLRQAMSDSILRPRVSLLAVAAFALLGIITAAFGLYGSISYRVNQRQQEIGIRLALGAPASSVRWDVQKRCLALVCSGAAIGLPMAFVLSKLITSLLYKTRPAQASAYLLVLIVFLLVALAASFGPARRASRMDPAAAIRYE